MKTGTRKGLLAVFAAAAAAGLITADTSLAGPLHPGYGAQPCKDPAPAYRYPDAPLCGQSYEDADPDIRYGAGLTLVDPNGGHFDYQRTEDARRRPRRPNDPDEIAQLLTKAYGRRSLLSRSARSVATVAKRLENSTDRALSGINRAGDRVVEGARTVLHAEDLPDFRFRSKVNTRYFGLALSASW